MRNNKCGCRGRGCSNCCPTKKNVAGPTGPQGAPGVPGPTGPCCTGATGPEGPPASGARVFAGGQLTIDEECNLILFNSYGILAMEAVLIAPNVRGWLVTFDPIPCAQVPTVRPSSVFGHVVFHEEAGVDFEAPSVHLVSGERTLINHGDGTCSFQSEYYLIDTTTGLPVDPCSGTLFYSVFPFHVITGGPELFVATNIASPCGPVCPPPAPGVLPASSPARKRRNLDW